MVTSTERADRVAKEFLGGINTANPPARTYLAALVKRALDQQAEEAIALVQKLLPYIDPRVHGGSRELFAAAREFLAAHGVR